MAIHQINNYEDIYVIQKIIELIDKYDFRTNDNKIRNIIKKKNILDNEKRFWDNDDKRWRAKIG